MSTSVTFNGVSYTVPAVGDASWGTNVSNYLIAIATGCLQKTGGAFTLSQEVNFGATYGLKVSYLKTQTVNPSATGIVRLGNTDIIGWRNAANSADLALTVNASNQLTFAGLPISAIALGTANQLLGINNAGTAQEYKSFAQGTLQGVTFVLTSANTMTLDTVQDIRTTASPTFAGLTVGSTTVPTSGTIVTTAATQTLTNKTLTSPTIGGGTHTGITGLGIRDTSAAFDVTVAATSSTALTSARTLTLDMVNSSYTFKAPPLANFSGLSDGGSGTVLSTLGTGSGYSWISPLTNPMTTLGDIIYENATPAAARLAGNTTTTKKYLTQTGTGSASAAPAWNAITAPTQQIFTSPYYTFTIPSSSITAGAIYTNNGSSFTVVTTTVSSTSLLTTSSNGAPAASGTLTYVSGTPSGNLSFSAVSSTAQTYTAPTGVVWLRVRMVGGGGAGGSSGTGSPASGGGGQATTFGSSLLSAGGGAGGSPGGAGATGGSSSLGSGPVGIALTGGGSGGGDYNGGSTTNYARGGIGGSSAFGGAGYGDVSSNTAGAGVTNTGGGGGGGGTGPDATTVVQGGAGGGSGGFIDAIISSPSSTYSYVVGAGGTPGAAGANGIAGAAGGSGIIIVEEHY